MNNIDLTYRKTYRIGKKGKYKVEFSFENGGMTVDCQPEIAPKDRSNKLLSEYRAARNEFIATMGLNVIVVEL